MTPLQDIELTPHPSTPCPLIQRVTVRLELRPGRLSLDYRVHGEIDALHIPPPASPRQTDGLWQTTCFEAFVKAKPLPGANTKAAGEGYCEFNFSPSSAWAAYRFTGYRQGMAAANLAEPVAITTSQTPDGLELQVSVNLDGLTLDGCLNLGLAAVIQNLDGGLSYWATAHPPGKPDFHHPDGFVVAF